MDFFSNKNFFNKLQLKSPNNNYHFFSPQLSNQQKQRFSGKSSLFSTPLIISDGLKTLIKPKIFLYPIRSFQKVLLNTLRG